MLIDSKFLHLIIYEKCIQSRKPVVRSFCYNFAFSWAEAITEQKDVFLKRTPSLNGEREIWGKTEEGKDKYTIKIGSHKVTLTFDFYGEVEEEPEIQIEETKASDSILEPRKFVLVGVSAARLVFSDSTVLHIVFPQFHYEEDINFQQIMFLLFHEISYNADNSKTQPREPFFVHYQLIESG